MIHDLLEQLKSPNWDEVPIVLFGEEAFSGITPSSDFAHCLSVVLERIRRKKELWDHMILYFPPVSDELVVVELAFPEPLYAGLGVGNIAVFVAALNCDTPSGFLHEGEQMGVRRLRNGRATDFFARGPVSRAPRCLYGPMQTLRFAVRKARQEV